MGKLKEIDDKQYKVDFDILNGYISFSSELLRLSLLAMGAFGTLFIIKIKGESSAGSAGFLNHPWWFLISMTLFALCSGATLFHRFFASDSMSWYICWLRAIEEGNTEKASTERKGFHRLLKRSEKALIVSEILFGCGVLTFMIAIVNLLGSR